MSSPSDLSLDYKPSSYSMIQKPFGDQVPDQTQKLEEFLARLEEERLKIEAFKRELPLCMQLLNNAMETYRQQLEAYQTNQGGARPVLEEFMPLKHMTIDGAEKAPNAPSEKANWMISAQLWSPASDTAKQASTIKETEQSFNVSPKFALDAKLRNGGAFLPFSKEKNKGSSSVSRVVPDLALASSEKEMEEKKCSEMENGGTASRRESSSKSGGVSGTAEQGKGGSNPTEGQPVTQAHRKARRCWSPDLHRRFVNALQILGGSQVATPKQIRELMKVDGLTNDEVKSHLQKYRLHTRRPIPAPQATATAAPQLVVLGGIWVPPEYAASAGATGIYGAHPGAAHYCATPVPQEFYPAPPHHHHHHHLHPQLHRGAAAFKGRVGSPESDLRSCGERSESIEEGTEEGEEREEEEETEEEDKSDGANNWNGEEKALVAAGGKAAEESSGSDVALKF